MRQEKQRLGLIGFVVLAFMVLTPRALPLVIGNGKVETQRRVPSTRPQKRASIQRSRIDYSQFSHLTHVTTQKLACDSCHKFPTKNWKEARKGDAAFPDVAEFPDHASCLNCHRQQFFARERPSPVICSNCHVNVTPRNTARFLFPSLADIADSSKAIRDVPQEFKVNFPHDKHLDVVGWNGPRNKASFVSVSWQQTAATSEPKSCAVCHQTYQPQGKSDDEYITSPPKNLGDNYWLKKGTFKTIPNSHTVCFTCHNADLGIPPAQSECNGCHKLTADQKLLRSDFDQDLAKTFGVTDKTILTTWKQRGSSGAFRHEGGEHPNVSCMNCHSVATMNTVDKGTMTVPIRSCGGAEGCHVTATSDDGGILNYEIDQRKSNPAFICTKCHISFGKDALPDGHLKAILALKK